ncbi:MAG: PVC-type heme-binding CxxCH protein [Sphingobacteriaceae bacterium]
MLRISKRFLPLYFSPILLFGLACNQSKTSEKDSKKSKDLFADNIRVTDFQTPEKEREGFTLPEGFEITLFASEPNIHKPINMDFDERGRLWVTNTVEYPMPAVGRKGRDKITILEDTDGDGKADKFINFTDGLNIPIAITKVNKGAIAYSIPNVYRFTDNDGDDIADDSTKLIGPFNFIDTHGMVNNFIRGFDGWIYACHGFANTSTVAGMDGDSITMVSGNTFRFREDGSRVEATTYGRINPFGYAYDDWGYLYSLDCHTKPIYQLIPGAVYPSWGHKMPAFGWAPEMMSYEFGSTANSGLVYYTGDQFPEAFRNNFYSGNVVTGRINRNTMTLQGSSPVSKREEDFLISADPWFRPVDIKTGPDGSMYVADFYNKIIGHYEVEKEHPGRDRTSGRIWKITYKGKNNKNVAVKDWSKATLDELIRSLNYSQLNTRMMIANRVVDIHKEKAIAPVKKLMISKSTENKAFIQGLWILYRLNGLTEPILESALRHADPMVRVHALLVLVQLKKISPAQFKLVLAAAGSNSPKVKRGAAEVLSHFPKFNNVPLLIDMYVKSSKDDSHLKYTLLMGLRDQLLDNGVMKSTSIFKWSDAQSDVLMKVIPEVPSAIAATFALDYLQKHSISPEQQVTYMAYIGRYLPAGSLDKAVALVRKNVSEIGMQYTIYETIRKGISQKGQKASQTMRQWGIDLATKTLENTFRTADNWRSAPIEKKNDPLDPWRTDDKFHTETVSDFKAIKSDASGLEPMDILYSVPFKIPSTLSMDILDYDIFYRQEGKGTSKNVVRIRLAANNKIIAQHRFSQNTKVQDKDIVQRNVPFKLKEWEGQLGYIEVVDSSNNSYIGIGKLTPEVMALPSIGTKELYERRVNAINIASDYKIVSLETLLQKIVKTEWMNYKVRVAAANALMNIDPVKNQAVIGNLYMNPDQLTALRKGFASALGQVPSKIVYEFLKKGVESGDYALKVLVAGIFANNNIGIDHLLNAIKEGKIPSAVVTEVSVREALAANARGAQQKKLETLTASGVNEREARDSIIRQRVKGLLSSTATAEEGRSVFIQNCSMCHAVKGQGGAIGPQLEGIGNWGPQALAEKVLDPNRNISTAFRTYNITLKNGKKMSGLYRRTEGKVLVFANPSGGEFTVAQNDIKERKSSKYTLMPDQFRNTIPEKDFHKLLKYLLSIKD